LTNQFFFVVQLAVEIDEVHTGERGHADSFRADRLG
jgi:hypothetical protein